jgi:hypothetical protein
MPTRSLPLGAISEAGEVCPNAGACLDGVPILIEGVMTLLHCIF